MRCSVSVNLGSGLIQGAQMPETLPTCPPLNRTTEMSDLEMRAFLLCVFVGLFVSFLCFGWLPWSPFAPRSSGLGPCFCPPVHERHGPRGSWSPAARFCLFGFSSFHSFASAMDGPLSSWGPSIRGAFVPCQKSNFLGRETDTMTMCSKTYQTWTHGPDLLKPGNNLTKIQNMTAMMSFPNSL